MVMDFFTAFLHFCCTVIHNSQIHKDTREKVLWRDSRSRWKRTLCGSSSAWPFSSTNIDSARLREYRTTFYEHFMVYYMSFVEDFHLRPMSGGNHYIMNAKLFRRLLELDLLHGSSTFRKSQGGMTVFDKIGAVS
ncbi:hypothetical protein BDV10DRAFT_36674 [Aspergillus recurvatus]